jgi:hypothetical protein
MYTYVYIAKSVHEDKTIPLGRDFINIVEAASKGNLG